MRLIPKFQQLLSQGVLAAAWDFRQGSLLDQSGNGNLFAVSAGAPWWQETGLGSGVSVGPTGNNLSAGNAAGLQLGTCTLLSFFQCDTRPNSYATILFKNRAWAIFLRDVAGSWRASLWDYNTGTPASTTAFAVPMGVPCMAAGLVQSGVVSGSQLWFEGTYCAVGTVTVVNQLNPVTLLEAPNEGLAGTHLSHAIVSRILTSQELTQIRNEWLAERCAKNVARRGFVYKYPSKNSSEYAAAGILADWSLIRGGDGKLRDEVGSYPGTVTGIVIPGQNGEGAVFNGTSGVSNHGNAVPLNGVATYSMEHIISLPATAVQYSSIWSKYDNVTTGDIVRIFVLQAAPGPYKIVHNEIFTAGAGSVSVTTNSTCMRAGVKQHLLVTRDPNGSVIYVDGEVQPSTKVGSFSATTPTAISTKPFIIGADSASAGWQAETVDLQRLYSPTLTPTQARAAYVQNFGKKLLLRETLEDVPVSLVASVGAGGKIGPWDIISGTWKCSETSDGKRWLECVTAGVVATQQPFAFGTWTWTMLATSAAALTRMYFVSATSAVSNIYEVNLQGGVGAGRAIYIAKTGANISNTNAGVDYVLFNVAYQYCINRRPSDGRFTLWIKGGAYTDWTLVSMAGGAGTNPTAADSTYVTSGWMCFQAAPGHKLCLYDPRDPTVALNVWQGCLSPTMGGEIPNTSPINLRRYSEQYDNALWIKANVTVTPNVVASPFGTPGVADLITATAGGSTAVIGQTITANPLAQYTQSVYAKASVGTALTLHLADTVTGECSAVFNPATGALVSTTAGVYGNVSAGSELLPGGWWRYWISGSQPSAQTSLRAYTSLTNNADAVYLWGDQEVQGPCAGAYRESQ